MLQCTLGFPCTRGALPTAWHYCTDRPADSPRAVCHSRQHSIHTSLPPYKLLCTRNLHMPHDSKPRLAGSGIVWSPNRKGKRDDTGVALRKVTTIIMNAGLDRVLIASHNVCWLGTNRCARRRSSPHGAHSPLCTVHCNAFAVVCHWMGFSLTTAWRVGVRASPASRWPM